MVSNTENVYGVMSVGVEQALLFGLWHTQRKLMRSYSCFVLIVMQSRLMGNSCGGRIVNMLDLRLATYRRVYGSLPVLVTCPFHNDEEASLAIYIDHGYCFGCKQFIRHQAGLALLLGWWNGNPSTELEAVNRVRPYLNMPEFQVGSRRSTREYDKPVEKKAEPLDPTAPGTFQRYLYHKGFNHDLQRLRGYSDATVRRFGLGHSGTHWSIPVYDANNALVSLRFRADERFTGREEPKYSAVKGHNPTVLYPLHLVQPCNTVWVCEGELDAVTVNAWGVTCLTLTNGAGQLSKLPAMLLSTVGWRVDEWIIATDIDEIGEETAYKLKMLLNGTSKRAVWETGKDLTEFKLAGGRLEDLT